jgi:phage tail tape-measure protein
MCLISITLNRFSQVEVSNQKMIDAENEVLVLKRKHAASLRELTRELQSCKKQIDLSGTEASARSNANHRTSPLSQV